MNFIQKIQKNAVFKFLSSVRLAVPLMLCVLVAAAVGTIYESQYNAQIATVRVYRSVWFLALMGLLWINIFCATVSRWPFKKHHTGFVITHIGLLTLLIGGMMTATIGIDGQLRVVQGSADSEVFLPELVLKVSNDTQVLRKIDFSRSLNPMKGEQLDSLNDTFAGKFIIDEYQPYVSIERGFTKGNANAGDLALQFEMKSAFFHVNEWLHSRGRPELQMGPALLRIVIDGKSPKTKPVIAKSKPSLPAHQPLLRIKEGKSGKLLGEFTIAQLKKAPQSVGPFKISLNRALEEAMVAGGGKIEDSGTPGKNPALDLKIEHQGQAQREIAFARFPTFSLHPNGLFGLKFEYVHPRAMAEQSTGATELAEESDSPRAGTNRMGNVVEFHVKLTGAEPQVTAELFKNGKQVLRQLAKVDEPIQTPWMGMMLTLKAAIAGAEESEEVKPIELPKRAQMPPSAIKIRLPGMQMSEARWIIEGERRPLPLASGPLMLYYGPDSIKLPFHLHLDQFTKVDYPGTETAMSYQSEVKVNGQGEPITIAMNEPLHHSGFTLYQSSYVLEPGQPPMSIFSVNRDPGRWVKYLGSIILVLGIAIFALMRSHWYLNLQKRKAKA